MTERPRQWPRLGRGPHAAALLLSRDSSKPLVCSEQTLPDPKCAPKKFPTLEQLLCSLVHRANHPGEAYPALSGQCGSVTPKPPTIAADESGTGISGWFQRLFGRFSGSRSSSTPRSIPEAVTDQAGTMLQRGTETLGVLAAGNWLWQRARGAQQPPVGN